MRRPLATLTLILAVALAGAAVYAVARPGTSSRRTVAGGCPRGLVREDEACARLGHPEGAELLKANTERAAHQTAPFDSVRAGAADAAAARADALRADSSTVAG